MEKKIIQDTREQLPLDFNKSRTFEVEVKKLDEGDYGLEVDGILQPVVVERKGMSDLFSTLTRDHARFKREITRCIEKNILMYVIVEGSYTCVYTRNFKGFYRSSI